MKIAKINKDIIKYMYAPLITILILMLLFFCNGFFPFGGNSIVYSDMGQGSVATYYYFYDLIHGQVPLLFNWDIAAGTNIMGLINNNCLLNPLNFLFFYLVPRNMILESMSFFIIFKMALMSLFVFVLLQKIFSIDIFWKVIFSLMYAFSGYILQYYTNVMWLDIVLLFPLLILALYYMFEKNKVWPYILILTFCLINNLYLSYMILLYLFIIGGLYILLVLKENKGRHIINFGVGTVSSLLLSLFITLPAFIQMSSSARYSSSEFKYLDILKSVDFFNSQKLSMLLGTSLIFVLIFILFKFYKKDKKNILFIILSLLILILPIFFENINLMWHKGSYVGFPVRFGFMITLSLILSACYFLETHKDEYLKQIKAESNIKIFIFLGISYFIILGTILRSLKYNVYDPFAINVKNLFIYALFFLFYFFALKLKKKKIIYSIITLGLITEIFCYSYVAICQPHPYGPEHKLQFIALSNQVKDNLDLKNDNLSRIKNSDTLLNANYPFLIQYPALSNWIHILSGDLNPFMEKMGYSTSYTRILDAGGTTFSDALLNIKHTITIQDLDSNLYNYVKKTGDFNLYENKFTLPFGMVLPSGILDKSIMEGNCFEIQNKIYKNISNDQDDLFEMCKYKKETSSLKDERFTINISGKKELYFYITTNIDEKMKIYVNGNAISIPTVSEKDNLIYPANFNNNVINLGSFNDEKVDIKLECDSNISNLSPNFATMDLPKINKLKEIYAGYDSYSVASGRDLQLKVNSLDENEVVFIPVLYDKGWSCTVNDQNTDIQKVFDCFMGVKLQPGDNIVQLHFFPYGMKLGFIVSIFTMAVLIIIFILKKLGKININENSFVVSCIIKIFAVAFGIMIVILYIIPILYTCFYQI